MSTLAERLADPALAARVAQSRAAQGLPPVITDPVVLDRVAAVFAAVNAASANRSRVTSIGRNSNARAARRNALLRPTVRREVA